ncbi:transcription antitermination factor NusB [Viridibacillus sp. FSL R5-0477]|uniref:Transcription antitermination protein NusB n=2 Tax=Viridibacillus TaxID=496496 RepID=W4EZW8_9BACL|nr:MULTISPECIES: transcription antitermination factor NusB [Viridibacillus]ETT85361.1 N utilization substance protein B-like protein [Viridibacillus arenosi FSL R5-213]KOO52066.1 antitermination protein NusB [Viridibacillus arvi]OMC80905.1 N utilization substance protein B [Viridibacillus sp. FSL H8-0123]OMC86645.1 N utilization substance protein B [Viridibacillus sp. FSL H7-0596]OMC89421.1 N utilization substance protein B [Viridibacillus arenosi]
MKRREAREKAIQVLFQLENTELTVTEAIEHIVGEESSPFFEQIVQGTVLHMEEIDKSLVEKLENWSLPRLAKIERTILRLAVYEILYTPETPKNVVLNEAIELSKTYGDEKSSRFVNGVLSKYAK